MLGDITCDSDGKIDQFIDLRDVRNTLELHPFNGEPYYLGAFLLGAYQEILGDLHNLFGDTNAVHVSLDEDGEVNLDAVIKGDTVREVLPYVQYYADELLGEDAQGRRAGRARRQDVAEESRLFLQFYESGLEGYTYLEEPEQGSERRRRCQVFKRRIATVDSSRTNPINWPEGQRVTVTTAAPNGESHRLPDEGSHHRRVVSARRLLGADRDDTGGRGRMESGAGRVG